MDPCGPDDHKYTDYMHVLGGMGRPEDVPKGLWDGGEQRVALLSGNDRGRLRAACAAL